MLSQTPQSLCFSRQENSENALSTLSYDISITLESLLQQAGKFRKLLSIFTHVVSITPESLLQQENSENLLLTLTHVVENIESLLQQAGEFRKLSVGINTCYFNHFRISDSAGRFETAGLLGEEKICAPGVPAKFSRNTLDIRAF
ncbi:hypothetical protein CDAR_261671 [Caerostris darwini]|uniref:Uncharacterized protein n=1 Tax=Caerostris darwini TaxID=1538125 RepID=A0AAV4STG4_9ARAC|nr:hypothetical protein CDAR_261671 [Caerostris darwini]